MHFMYIIIEHVIVTSFELIKRSNARRLLLHLYLLLMVFMALRGVR